MLMTIFEFDSVRAKERMSLVYSCARVLIMLMVNAER